MIQTRDAIARARALLGTPYAQLDCINLIKKVIRDCPGGEADYTTAGTNALWDSYGASAKYRDLTWRQEGTAGARAGMLAFKRSGEDVHHVGLVTQARTVVHASSAAGETVETALDGTWDLLAAHRYIEVAEEQNEGGEGNGMDVKWVGIVNTQDGPLNLRDRPGLDGERIGQIPKGAQVGVLWDEPRDGWLWVQYDGQTGYVAAGYLVDVESIPDQAPEAAQPEPETAERSDGRMDVTLRAITPAQLDAVLNALGWRESDAAVD